LTPSVAATGLLVPPIFLLLVALFGALIRRRNRHVGRFLTWAGLAGLLILAMPGVSALLMIALERNIPLSPPLGQPPQAIVILGGDVVRGGTQTVAMELGPISFERVGTGAALSRRTDLPVLVSGGSLRAGEPPVATLMAESLERDFRISARWIEGESKDTWQNAHMSAPILREQGIRSIYVVTQAWHMRRAIMAFADTGIAVTAAPPRLDRLSAPLVANLVPQVAGWQRSYYALHEWIGCVYYALR
jgi:uncharacterized SAM-binding protein YcdF (DUF218 family)